MVKVQAPALSLDASGSLAGAIVFSKWKGRNYVRSLVKPSNPRTGGQTGVRSSFKFLSQIWNGLSTVNKATWEANADQDVVSPFNAFMKYNLLRNRNFIGPSEAFPAAEATAPDAVALIAATAGVRQVTIGINTVAVVNGAWGYMLYRSTTSGFTPAFDNLIAMIEADGITPSIFVDTPLDPDTYYYDTKPFAIDGSLGALEGEVSAIVA